MNPARPSWRTSGAKGQRLEDKGRPSLCSSQSRNRALAHAIAAREFGKRSTLRPSPSGLGLLRLRQFRFPAHALPALLRPAAALGGAGADKVALHVRQAAENSNDQAFGAGAGVGPRLRQ